MIGKKFGKLLVKKFAYIGDDRHSYWKCKCECGNIVTVRKSNLGKTTFSCGCYKKSMLQSNKKKNKYMFINNYIEIHTEDKDIFYVDKDDFDLIKKYYWYINNHGYVHTWKNRQEIFLHRLIMNPPKRLVVDHINHNKKDNRKSNLRICTQQQNSFNQKINVNNKLGVKGVYKDKNSYRATICINGKTRHLGSFKTINEAKEARTMAEKNYFGRFRLMET